jgi:murein DD-endopeptidase MepM/ murein hydrolase activator NlpD
MTTRKNRNMARIIAIVLAALMLFSVVMGAIISLNAGAARVTKAQIDKLKEEKKEYERKKQEIQSRINTIEYERMTEVAKKGVLDERILVTGEEIDNINETIDIYVLLIADKELEVVDAQSREHTQFELYKERVRDMEENGVISYLEIIFDSTSFTDLLARIDFVGDIMAADENRYNALQQARLDTISAKDDLEATKAEMEDEKVLLGLKYEELEAQLEEANALIKKLDDTLEEENDLYLEVAADADKIQREINEKTEELKRQEERDRQARLAAERAKGTGVLAWPTASHQITSGFGTRLHPVYKVYRTHWGIDINAAYGAKIMAADNGTVITSTYNSSYGHYVVVSHGNGMTTLYAHMSQRKVSVGARVTKGQLIGLVGSTGVSTGPHLHFEVSVNGVRKNPVNYL